MTLTLMHPKASLGNSHASLSALTPWTNGFLFTNSCASRCNNAGLAAYLGASGRAACDLRTVASAQTAAKSGHPRGSPHVP
jgi:hypothetical protein